MLPTTPEKDISYQIFLMFSFIAILHTHTLMFFPPVKVIGSAFEYTGFNKQDEN